MQEMGTLHRGKMHWKFWNVC